MSMLGFLVLSAAIGVGGTRNPSAEKTDALKAVAKATYLQTETDKVAKELEKKYVSKKVKEYGGWITGTARIVHEQKISFEWTF